MTHLKSDKPQTKLGILNMAVEVIMQLEQQVRGTTATQINCDDTLLSFMSFLLLTTFLCVRVLTLTKETNNLKVQSVWLSTPFMVHLVSCGQTTELYASTWSLIVSCFVFYELARLIQLGIFFIAFRTFFLLKDSNFFFSNIRYCFYFLVSLISGLQEHVPIPVQFLISKRFFIWSSFFSLFVFFSPRYLSHQPTTIKKKNFFFFVIPTVD